MNRLTLDKTPTNLLNSIENYLNYNDMISCRLVSKAFNDVFTYKSFVFYEKIILLSNCCRFEIRYHQLPEHPTVLFLKCAKIFQEVDSLRNELDSLYNPVVSKLSTDPIIAAHQLSGAISFVNKSAEPVENSHPLFSKLFSKACSSGKVEIVRLIFATPRLFDMITSHSLYMAMRGKVCEDPIKANEISYAIITSGSLHKIHGAYLGLQLISAATLNKVDDIRTVINSGIFSNITYDPIPYLEPLAVHREDINTAIRKAVQKGYFDIVQEIVVADAKNSRVIPSSKLFALCLSALWHLNLLAAMTIFWAFLHKKKLL